MSTQLTPAQITTLTNDIANNAAQVSVDGGPLTAISAVLHNADASFAVADWYNLFPVTNFFGYYGSVPVHSIIGSIRWNRLTPVDAISATNFTQESLACQGIQFNLQLLLGFQASVDCTLRSVVQGFSDALSAVPSAANGATQDAGWTTAISGSVPLPQVLSRLATNAEKLFANTTAWGQGGSGASQTPGSTGPAILTFQGKIQPGDVQVCWNISG